MSNLSEAIEYLGNAQEAVDAEAEIDLPNAATLLEIVDQIRQCRGRLEELAGLEPAEEG